MSDIFQNKILCKACETVMKPVNIEKNGFILRALQCPKCSERIYHPSDLQEFEQFQSLKRKTFSVKLRLVGNSYAVSIPKEIVNFIHEQEKIMDDMVKLCFTEAGKLSLMFGEEKE